MMHSLSYGEVDNNNLLSIIKYIYTLNEFFKIVSINLHPKFYSNEVYKYEEIEIIRTYDNIKLKYKDKEFLIVLNSLMDGNFCVICR